MGNPPKHQVTIIVNTRPKVVDKDEITFEEVVQLAYENPPAGETTIFTITYKNGHGNKPQGQLLAGESVKGKDGMIFNVSHTDRS